MSEVISLYNGEIQLEFDPVKHRYSRRDENGKSITIPGVSTICKILDKSTVLVPWSAKKVAEKMLTIMPYFESQNTQGLWFTESIAWEEFEYLVMEAKKAPREILEDAGDVGTQAHAIIESLIITAINENAGIVDYDYPFREDLDDRVLNCVIASLAWMKEHAVKWLATEQFIYSRKYDYAGIMDGLAEVDGVLSVIDWKTGRDIYSEFLLQTAAYLMAYVEMTGLNIYDRHILRLGKEEGDFFHLHVKGEIVDHYKAFTNCQELYLVMKKINKYLDAAKKVRKLEKPGINPDWLSEIE